jgi:hypothetical protein
VTTSTGSRAAFPMAILPSSSGCRATDAHGVLLPSYATAFSSSGLRVEVRGLLVPDVEDSPQERRMTRWAAR